MQVQVNRRVAKIHPNNNNKKKSTITADPVLVVGAIFFPFLFFVSVNPLAVVLARGSSVSETGMLLRFESEGREAGATRVPVDPVRRGGRGSVRARGGAHGRIDRGASKAV